jgi:DNA-binding winged helix-turn-helix (wHTH) protein
MLGDWRVDVHTRRLSRAGDTLAIEPLPMAVLVALCKQPGQVVSAESLLQTCWPGAEAQGDNPVHKVVAGLRRALQDSATQPVYLETIRKQGYRLLAPVRVLSEQGLRSHAEGWRGQSPFCGLEAFDQAHASVFFGRDAAVAALRERLGQQWRRGHPLVLLLGPSGSGKTSLVQAGLLPALAQQQPEVLGDAASGATAPLQVCAAATVDLGSVGRRASIDHLDAWAGLAGAMLDWDCQGRPLLPGYSVDSLATALCQRPQEVLRQLAIGLDTAGGSRRNAGRPALLVLDRLEALLQEDAAHTDAWFDTLAHLVRSGLVLVLAVCRNDFYAALARRPLLMAGKDSGAHLDLVAPQPSEIAQMIRLPARAAGLRYGCDDSGLNRLDDRLCADAAQAPDALPLLQYTLQQLYLQRDAGGVLAWSHYEAMGGLEGAIGQRAEALLGELPAEQQAALPPLLSRLVTLGEGEAVPTSRWMPDAELTAGHERALVEAFVGARLLVADLSASGKGYRVAHEALLRRWPRVTAWVAGHRAALVARDSLAPWLSRWVQARQAPALLLPRGATLWTAVRALAEVPGLFGPLEREFVLRSQRRLRRQRWHLGAATAGALLLATVAIVAAIGHAHQAELAVERERQSRHLASFMLGELADGLRPIGKLDLLSGIGEQGLKLLGQAEDHDATGSASDALQRARALVVIGEVNSSRGQGRTDIAVDALTAARQLLEALEPIERRPELRPAEFFRTLGAASFWLGQIAYDASEMDIAAQAMGRYREASERWLQVAPDDAAAKAELGYALQSLGSIEFRRSRWQAADRSFRASLVLKLEALDKAPENTDAREAVANSRTWLGLVSYVNGQPQEALVQFDAARQVRVMLAAARSDEQLRLRDLGTLDLRRGEALHAVGRFPEAAAAVASGVERLRDAQQHDPSNLYWRADRLHAEAHLLLARLDAGLPVEPALAALRAQLLAEAPATDGDPAREYLRRAALLRVALADAELAARQRAWPRVGQLLAGTADEMATVLRLRPDYWQARELQARRALLALRAAAAPDGTGRADCARLRDALQPAIGAGQAGLVLEAWMAANACAGMAPDEGLSQRLTAGGYVPMHPALATAFSSPPPT